MVFAVQREFESYLLLIPVLSLGLLWARWRGRSPAAPPCRILAAVATVGAVAALGAFFLFNRSLSWGMASFVFAVFAAVAWTVGAHALRRCWFPLAFLAWMIPLPPALVAVTERLLQQSSAQTAALLFSTTDLPVLRLDALSFQLPGLTLHVAPECSGIQSTLALLVLASATAYIFLRGGWRRFALCLAVIPLGILRNAVRIFVLAELCIRRGPAMIDSYIHHKGGWIFFLAALVPLAALLLLLIRSEYPSAARSRT